MKARALLLLGISAVASAQVALYSFDGANDTPVGSTFNFGSVVVDQPMDVRFHLKNLGSAPVNSAVIGTPQGKGFTLAAVNGSLGQNTLAPQAELEFTIRFSVPSSFPAPTPGTYSANLQITSSAPTLNVILLANLVPGPTLTVFPACSPSSNGGITYPSVTIGSTGLCNFSVQNPNAQAISISLGLSGDPAFHGPVNLSTPFTLKPNDAFDFVIQFTPVCGTVNYSGALSVNGRSFPLSGTGLTPPLPKPALSFDAAAIASGEQHTLSMTLPTSAACAATGNVSLAFNVNPGFAGVADDRSIFFLSGSTRSLQFSVKAGDTRVSIAGQASAAFQTGTTAGTVTFSLTGTPIASDATTTLTIAPAPVVIETAAASNQRAGELDIQVVGYDNTYSVGGMSFTFFDASGKAIGAPVAADFTSNFKTFYSGASSGSTFLMRVSFPVLGDQSQVAKVQVTLTNSAGQAQTGNLAFQ